MRSFRILGPLAVVLLTASAFAAGPNEVDDAVAKLCSAARAGNDIAVYDAAATVVAFGENAIPRLTASLDKRVPNELIWILRCLKEIKSPLAKETVFALCGHAKSEVRAEAAVTAAALGHEAAVSILIRLAGDADALVRRRAFDSLLDTGTVSPDVIPVAARGIVDPDQWIVLDAIQILDRMPRPAEGAQDRVVAAVAEGIGKLDEKSAPATFDLLVRRAGQNCGPILLKALELRRPEVLVAALDAAAKIRLVAGVPRIARLMKGSDRAVTKAAIECLSKINEHGSVVYLVDALDGCRDAELIDTLAIGLRRMTGQLLGTDVLAWRKYLADHARSGLEPI